MLHRTLYLIKIYLLTLCIFIAAKLGFMLCNITAHPFSVGDIFQVVWYGLSLDLSMGLYFVIIPLLIVLFSIWIPNQQINRCALRCYFALISVAFSLIFVADTSLYEFWQFKLEASCLQYLETPAEAMASVSTMYLVLRFLVFVGLSLIMTTLYWLIPFSCTMVRQRLLSSAFYLLTVPLLVIGIRGGLNESTTNIGQVYYSQNPFLNHSAVNPVFSFFASFEKTAQSNMVYHYMDDTQCENIISELYNTESIDSDTLLTTQSPNIILILLESCGGTFTEIGGRDDVMPHLNQLSREGIYFTNCYGNTWRTDRGTVCTWSGYPSFPDMSVMKMPSKSKTLPNIARTLKKERGYHTFYLYGGDINFTNMRSYLVAGGFEQLHWKKDYSSKEGKSAKWGVCDSITFQSLYHYTQVMKQPFLIGYSTLSSHEPWDVSIRKFDDKVLNAFFYLDQCLGDFIERFRQSPVWENTLVIFLPDHGIPYNGIGEQSPLKNHIPMIWVGGVVKGPRRIEKVCNQTDLPATLLGQLGIRHDDFTFSRDVLSKTYTKPFAINTYTEGFSIIDSTSFVNYDLISERIAVEKGMKKPQLLQWGQAILQASSKDLDARY